MSKKGREEERRKVGRGRKGKVMEGEGREGKGEKKGRGKGEREGEREVKEGITGREGEGKMEECRDKGWGRWGGKIGVKKNFFLS